MLQSIEHAVAKGESFAFETTLAGLAYSRKIPKWQNEGYRESLFFLKLDSVELAIEYRMRGRASAPRRHNIPRRLFAAASNPVGTSFQFVYSQIVDESALFDNSHATPQLLGWSEKDET